MNNGFNFYRIKSVFNDEADDGAIVQVKEESLVMATCYSEAEKIALQLTEGCDQYGDVNYEIVKTKIEEIAYNDTFATDSQLTSGLVTYYFEEDENTEVGLYAVSVMYHELNEKTGKEKTSSETIYVPANSSKEAIENTNLFLKKVGETRDWTIRTVKYDKAQSVLVTQDTHKQNIRA